MRPPSSVYLADNLTDWVSHLSTGSQFLLGFLAGSIIVSFIASLILGFK